MISHPELGKTRGSEGERRSAMPRLLEHTREVVEAILRWNDNGGVGNIARRLNSRLFPISCWLLTRTIDLFYPYCLTFGLAGSCLCWIGRQGLG